MLNIREADKKDIYTLIVLWHELIKHHQDKNNIFPISPNWRRLKEKELNWILESIQSVIYVIEIDEKIVGYIRGSIRKNPLLYDIRYEGNIEEIYIMPKHRKRGLGTKLVKTIIEEFRNREVEFIHIHVDIENSIGQSFWDTLKFHAVSVHRRYQVEGEQR